MQDLALVYKDTKNGKHTYTIFAVSDIKTQQHPMGTVELPGIEDILKEDYKIQGAGTG